METQIWQKYKDRGVIVLGINVDEPVSVVEAFIRQFQLTYPVLLGNSQLQNQYNLAGSHVSPYPRDYIIGKNGLIAYAADEFDPAAMVAVIEKELGKTAVEEELRFDTPADFALAPSYPNPFRAAQNRGLMISYQLVKPGEVVLQIFDLMGRRIRTLRRGRQNAGAYTLAWNGRDEQNELAPSGVYLVQLRVGSLLQTQKITLMH
jgi:hypothetical protein